MLALAGALKGCVYVLDGASVKWTVRCELPATELHYQNLFVKERR